MRNMFGALTGILALRSLAEKLGEEPSENGHHYLDPRKIRKDKLSAKGKAPHGPQKGRKNKN